MQKSIFWRDAIEEGSLKDMEPYGEWPKKQTRAEVLRWSKYLLQPSPQNLEQKHGTIQSSLRNGLRIMTLKNHFYN